MSVAGATVAGGVYYAANRLVFREECTVSTAGRQYTLEPEQARNAATITAVAMDRGLPTQAVTIALATALQESKLRNLLYGDRDSLGLFQQRPSQGWGTRKQILDPVYSAGEFYDHLVKVDGYRELPVTEAAQRVQRSALPNAYAQHEKFAAAMAQALTGRAEAALTCQLRRGDHAQEELKSNGLTPRADRLRNRLRYHYGTLSISGFQPGGVRNGHIEGSAHYDGRALDVMYRPVTAARKRQGWSAAHWAVAHAKDLGVATVIYDRKIWTLNRSAEGWRDYSHPSGNTTDPTLLHLDHVHVDVVRGG